jgi:hypothetical protein
MGLVSFEQGLGPALLFGRTSRHFRAQGQRCTVAENTDIALIRALLADVLKIRSPGRIAR